MGYVCGESIPLKVVIENGSSSDVKSVESGIGASYFCTAADNIPAFNHRDTKETTKTYCVEDSLVSISNNHTGEYTRNIEIPPVPPSFDHCDIIKLQYHIFVSFYTFFLVTIDFIDGLKIMCNEYS